MGHALASACLLRRPPRRPPDPLGNDALRARAPAANAIFGVMQAISKDGPNKAAVKAAAVGWATVPLVTGHQTRRKKFKKSQFIVNTAMNVGMAAYLLKTASNM